MVLPGEFRQRKGGSDVDLFLSRFRNGQWSDPVPININQPNSWESTFPKARWANTLFFFEQKGWVWWPGFVFRRQWIAAAALEKGKIHSGGIDIGTEVFTFPKRPRLSMAAEYKSRATIPTLSVRRKIKCSPSGLREGVDSHELGWLILMGTGSLHWPFRKRKEKDLHRSSFSFAGISLAKTISFPSGEKVMQPVFTLGG